MALARSKNDGYKDAQVEVSIPDFLEHIDADFDARRRVFCPLCDDEGSHNPGASYTADEMYYRCWVCGFSGDVVALAREWLQWVDNDPSRNHENTTMKEALEWLRATFRF